MNDQAQKKGEPSEPIWTFRGFELKASEFTTAMVHFFRAEMTRANVWRQRLDTTTNWAVVTTGAVVSLAFTQTDISHFVILIDLLLVTVFLVIEARRYRYYELWSTRVRLMETDFFAAMLVPPFHPSPDWAETLAESLLQPHFPISIWEALGRRLRRNYLWIYCIIGLAWLASIWLMPDPIFTWSQFLARTTMGPLPGEMIVASVTAFFVIVFGFAFFTVRLQEASGEVLPRFEGLPTDFLASIAEAGKRGMHPKAWFRPGSHKRKQLLTHIITGRPKEVSDRILKDMHRGATIISAKGAFTGEERGLLMIALTVTEVPQLRALVAAVDGDAFVIVSPAQSIFGKGFSPLEDDE